MRTVVAELEEREPERRRCTLDGECVVEAGSTADYMVLSGYHYRDHRCPPAVHQVYRARHRPSGRTVGAIVYAAPSLNLGIRNRIFQDRYKIGGRKVTNQLRAATLNRELELIIRVVVHPTFRGIGLGVRLIAETLRDRPYRYVEMSAAMGAVNPFAEKAGMTPVPCPMPANTERVLKALRSVGMRDEAIANPSEILRVLEAAPPRRRAFLEGELLYYCERWLRGRTNRAATFSVQEAAKRVAASCLMGSRYYLWENDAAKASTSPGTGPSPPADGTSR